MGLIVSICFYRQDQNVILQDGKVTAIKTSESKECELNGNAYTVHTVGLYLILKFVSGITVIWDKNTRMTVILEPYWNVCTSLISNQLGSKIISVTENYIHLCREKVGGG